MIAKSKAPASESGDTNAAEAEAPVAAPAVEGASDTEAAPSAPLDTADMQDTETSDGPRNRRASRVRETEAPMI